MTAVARTALLGAVLGLLCLFLLDAAQTTEVPPLVRVGRPAKTRLVVLFVDSLSERDVTRAAMPKLSERIERGALHGPVQPCADAITVPCMTAAITGSDHLSVFAVGTNFASGSSAIEHSVLGQLERAGYHAGYLGEHILAKTMAGLTYVAADLKSDQHALAQLSQALEQRQLDLIIVHLRGLDQTAHKFGDAAPEYGEARSLIDAQIAEAMAQLDASDHALVMGDHGHTPSGRHAAGLDTTSYAAYFGPQFARAAQAPMLMTDHAAIWARLFGFARKQPGWLDDYFAGRTLRAYSAEAASQSSTIPSWTLAICVLLACATCMPRLGPTSTERYRSLAYFVASLALMIALGAIWPDLRAFVWHSLTRIKLTRPVAIAATGLLGSALLGWLRCSAPGTPNTWHARYARVLTAALVFALPTVYGLGGVNVVQSWLALGLLGYGIWFARNGERRRAAALAFALVLAVSLIPVKHANYVLVGFTLYTGFLTELSAHALPLVAAGLLLFIFVAARLVGRAWPAWLALAIGGSVVALSDAVPAQWFLVPCALSLPLLLLALRSARFRPLAMACALPAVWFFYGGSLRSLTPILAVWSMCALLPWVFRDSDPLLRGAVLLSLVLISFRAAMGCRIAGIDFDFFFRLLPQDPDVTAHWLSAVLLTTIKYLHTVGLSLWLISAHEPDLLGALREAVCIGRARLGMCLFFLAGLVVLQPTAGAAIVGDASQEAALWAIALVQLAIVAWACQARAEA